MDLYHSTVKQALVHDGWTITHDPYRLSIEEKRLYADLGADRVLAADRGVQKIVVEVKSFLGVSDVKDLEQALGQYVLYQHVLEIVEPERDLYLAISTHVYESLFTIEMGKLLLQKGTLKLLVFDAENEVITQWIPQIITKT